MTLFQDLALCVAAAMNAEPSDAAIKILSPADLARDCPAYIAELSAEALLCRPETIGAFSAARNLIIVEDGEHLVYTVAHEMVHEAQIDRKIPARSLAAERRAIAIGQRCSGGL